MTQPPNYPQPTEKAVRPNPIHRRFRIFLVIAVVYVGLLALIPFGYDMPFFVAMVGGAVAGLGAAVVHQFRTVFRKPHTTEEDFEAAWNSRQQLKSNMIEIAEQVYDQVPLGKWQHREVSYPGHGFPIVYEEKYIELTSGGTGTYHFIQHDLDVKCHTDFQFKPGERGTILVRMTSPSSESWIPVAFGFDMEKNLGGEEQLVLWMEGDCPLEDEQEMHWPFNERFVRCV